MTTENPSRKESILKTLAITGLLGITVLIAWLAIQIVQIFPAALSSLVSIANSVYNYNPLETRALTITPGSTTVNSGESFTVSWDRPHASGTYVFSFACESEVTVDLRAAGKDFSDLNCNEQYDLGTVDSIDLTVTTEANRFTDLSYTIAFYRPNGHSPAASQTALATIVDASIAATETATSTEVAVSKPEPETPVTPSKPTATTSPVSTPSTTPTPGAPVQTFAYAIPVSDPNGTTDLVVSFLGIGSVTSRGEFVKTDRLVAGEAGALQFAVHNIGSRTSETWSYEVELPNGTTYADESETALKPNERAVITIGFGKLDTTARTANIRIAIATQRDRNLATNFTEKTLPISR